MGKCFGTSAFKHRNSKIIYNDPKDNAFGEFLLKEFAENVSDSSLFICKNEKLKLRCS